MDFYKTRIEAKRYVMSTIYEGKTTKREILLHLELKFGFGKIFLERCLEGIPLKEDLQGCLQIVRRKE